MVAWQKKLLRPVLGGVLPLSLKGIGHRRAARRVRSLLFPKDIEWDIPTGWWLLPGTKNDQVPKQRHYLLAAFVHKNNPDIVSNPLDAPSEATRDVVRKKSAEERLATILSAQSAQGSIRGKLEESMLSTKATLMQKNIKLQQTEGIEKQLNLMERFKSSFVNTSRDEGEEEYDKAVRDMLDDLPFMKKRKGSG